MANEQKLTTRAADFSAWYNELIVRAQLADYSPVRGFMVIRPNGYGIWELMQRALDDMFKETGHQNAYFPLLIPKSFIEREAKHIEGFAPEVAVVTHAGGKELEEPLVIRPTSETIIYHMFAQWVQSYRDLPLLINQWANVVRWELRTRLFLRTTEFLWQEGHTAHVSEQDAEEETIRMLGVYRTFMEEFMAMPVLSGRKTDSERFAGAVRTYCVEALMQNNWALQAGTSHNLGQNFSKQFDLKFQSEQGTIEYAHNTSWGVSTRMVGGLIMTHSDDSGLVIPPRLVPIQVVVVPIWKSDEEKAKTLGKAVEVVARLKKDGVRVHLDDRDSLNPGAKYFHWEERGIPMRVEIGPKDLDKGQLCLAMRVQFEGEPRKHFLAEEEALSSIPARLQAFQDALFAAAKARREANSHRDVSSWDQFKQIIEGEGGFVYAGWCGEAKCEESIKEETKATIRCIPDTEFRSPIAPTKCVHCDMPATTEAVWARAF